LIFAVAVIVAIGSHRFDAATAVRDTSKIAGFSGRVTYGRLGSSERRGLAAVTPE